jgi:hypothetical protein
MSHDLWKDPGVEAGSTAKVICFEKSEATDREICFQFLELRSFQNNFPCFFDVMPEGKIIIKQNWTREGHLPSDIFPILSASIPRKEKLKTVGKVLAISLS